MESRRTKLIGLSGWSKRESHLILEIHDSCEVPAGCGGVVLRWRGPADSVPVLLQSYHPENLNVRLELDGAVPATSRPLISPGHHCLALEMQTSSPDAGFLMVAASLPEVKQMVGPHESVKTGGEERQSPQAVIFRSLADGTWKCTRQQPLEEAWKLPGFDDSGWSALREVPLPAMKPGHYGENYRRGALEKLGAKPLGSPEKSSNLWIRKEFVLSM